MSFICRKLSTIILFLCIVFLLSSYEILLGTEGLYLGVSLALLFSALIFIVPKPVDSIVTGLSILMTSIYMGIQTVYFRAFGQYGSIQLLYSYRNEILGFRSSIQDLLVLEDIKFAILPLVSGLLLIVITRHSKIANRVKHHILNLITAVALISLSLIPFTQFQSIHASEVKSDESVSLYQSVNNLNQFVSTYGLVGWAYREINSFSGNPIVKVEATLDIKDQIAEVLLNKQAITVNPFTGLFKDKDILLIEAESLINLAIDPILTPTLYKLKKEGIFVEGYNSPLLQGSTSDTEFMVNTSLLPSFDGKITFNDYANNVYPQTLAKSFTNAGYTSIAAHNNYGEYYNRSIMLPNLGYDFYDAIGLEAFDNVEDSYVMDHLKWMMYEHDKSFAFWITFDAHQPYDLESLNPNFLNYYEIAEKTYPSLKTEEKVYMAKTMDFDRGLKKLLIDYENSDVLNDLVIIIYGDHYPKGIFSDESSYGELCTLQIQYENCLNTPLIIYNTSIEPMVKWKISNPLDIAPTIYDLFGIEVNDNLNLGSSIFDPNYEGFLFDAWNVIKTDNYIFDPLQDTINHNFVKDESIYLAEANNLYLEFEILKNIVPMNYFKEE